MITITRDMVRHAMLTASKSLDYNADPLQTGMGKCPWRVAIASMLCQRTKRIHAQPVLERILTQWPTHMYLAAASQADVASELQSLGLHNYRARNICRFSTEVFDGAWSDFRDLPGVGPYVNDAVGCYVFGCTELVCDDGPLVAYARRLSEGRTSPRPCYHGTS